jgi:hypothetical protein
VITTPSGKTVLPGDFAVVRVHGTVGKLIRLGEILNGDGFGDWEHAIFYAGDDPELGDDLILEAEPGGAKLVPFHYAAADVMWSTDNPDLDLTLVQQQMAMTVAKHWKGVPYSFVDYLALAAHRFHLPGLLWSKYSKSFVTLKTYVGQTAHDICSQLADLCRLELGSHLFSNGRWPGDVTPLDLANLIQGK